MRKNLFWKKSIATLLTLALLFCTVPPLPVQAQGFALQRSAADENNSGVEKTVTEKAATSKAGAKKTVKKQKKLSVKEKIQIVKKKISTAKKGRVLHGINGYKPSSKVTGKLKSAIKSIERSGYNVSFVMMDINTMKGISYNPSRSYYSASTIKGSYLVSAVAKQPSLLKSRYGTFRNILKYSENDSYVGFAQRNGFGCFNSWVKKAGAKYKRTGGNRCYGYFTAKNMAKIWAENYLYFTTNKTGKKLGKLFESPNLSTIHYTLRNKYKTRSKAGWIAMGGKFNVTNDTGIVYSDSGPYIIVILSSVPSNMNRLNGLVRALDYTHGKMVKK